MLKLTPLGLTGGAIVIAGGGLRDMSKTSKLPGGGLNQPGGDR
jgi:hypothetical protein